MELHTYLDNQQENFREKGGGLATRERFSINPLHTGTPFPTDSSLSSFRALIEGIKDESHLSRYARSKVLRARWDITPYLGTSLGALTSVVKTTTT